jgi:hypothetical protein
VHPQSGPLSSISSQLAKDPYRSPIEQDSSEEYKGSPLPPEEEPDLEELDRLFIQYPKDPREPLHAEPPPLPFEELVAPPSSTMKSGPERSVQSSGWRENLMRVITPPQDLSRLFLGVRISLGKCTQEGWEGTCVGVVADMSETGSCWIV